MIQIAFRTAISFIGMGLIAIISVPIIYNIAFDQTTLWSSMPAEAQIARDRIYDVWVIWIPALFFVVIIWAILSATRRDDTYS